MKVTDGITGYFRGALEELHHVRWPTRNQAIRLSAITVAFTFATAIVYGVVDFVLGRLVSVILYFT